MHHKDCSFLGFEQRERERKKPKQPLVECTPKIAAFRDLNRERERSKQIKMHLEEGKRKREVRIKERNLTCREGRGLYLGFDFLLFERETREGRKMRWMQKYMLPYLICIINHVFITSYTSI